MIIPTIGVQSHHPPAPLDNNVCEQALKKAILHRKNACFYKTENGAHAGDLPMSLIRTCELNSVNPYDYLTEMNKHASELSSHPADWMPGTYRDTLAKQVDTVPDDLRVVRGPRRPRRCGSAD